MDFSPSLCSGAESIITACFYIYIYFIKFCYFYRAKLSIHFVRFLVGFEKMAEKNILILCALKSELKHVLNNLSIKKKEENFYFANFEGINIIAAKSGLGKIRSAAFTQYCIDKTENLQLIVNFGSCGAIDENIDLGDMIFCNKTVEYDFISLRNFFPCFHIQNDFPDEFLHDFKFKKGTLLTATRNVDSKEKKNFLNEKFRGTVADWEGAAIAQIAILNKKRTMIFKCVTDRGDENILTDFNNVFDKVMNDSSKKMLRFLSFLNQRGYLFP